jgi:hypothetical protein
MLMVMLAALVSLVLHANKDILIGMGMVGFEVPDAISLKTTLSNLFDGKARIDQNYRTYAGLVYIYQFAYNELSRNYAVTNLILLLIAAIAFNKVVRFLYREVGAWTIVLILAFFCLNPYVLAVLHFPNKEIPIFAFLNVAIYFLLVRSSFVLALIFFLPIYWIRDGYFLIASFSFALCMLTSGSHRWLRSFIMLGIFFLFVLVPVDMLGYGDAAMRRSIDTAEILKGSGVVIYTDYLLRLYYSVVSFALFTPFYMPDGKFDFLNFGYFLMGLVVVAYFAKISTRKNISKFIEEDLNFIVLLHVFMLSFGLNVQPRYFFPLVCFMLVSLLDGGNKYLFFIIFICSCVSLILA